LVLVSIFAYPNEISGAACITRFDDKIVFIQEVFTNKISIPAGGLLSGETPESAARRETYEETGLLVEPTIELGRSKSTVFFNCIPLRKVQALKQKNRYQGNNLQTWKAPHYGIEVNLAMIAPPSTIVASDYRFPQQLPWLEKMFRHASNNEITFVSSFNTERPLVEAIQANYFNRFEQYYLSLSQASPSFVQMLFALRKLLNSPILILLAIVWMCHKVDYQSGLKLLIITVVLILLVLLLQRWLNYPSPNIFTHHYIANTKNWFSLPSIALVNWFFFYLLVCRFFKEKRRYVSWFAFSFLLLNMGLLLLEGSVFLADGVISICSGLLAYLGFKKWLEFDSTYLKENTRLCLVVLLVSCSVLTLFWPLIVLFPLITTLFTLLVVSYFSSGREFGKWVNKRFYPTFFAVMLVDFTLTIIFHLFVVRGEIIVALDILRYPIALLLFCWQCKFEDRDEKRNRTFDSGILSDN
jgi:hypothetical protein